jgi:hypothetical protein
MVTVLVALVLLFAGVAVIYLLLKNMTEDGIDIAAPGSCKRGRCAVQCRPPAEQAEEVPLQVADVGDQSKANS